MSRPLLCALALALASACGDAGDPPITGTRARFEPASLAQGATDFYALPFPSDLRSDGTGLTLSGFPNPKSSGLLDDYLAALYDSVPAFGSSAALYVGFSGPLLASTIPSDPAALLATDAAVQLIDLGDLGKLPGQKRDDGSTRGARTPLRSKWFGAATLFASANTLALLQFPSDGHFAIFDNPVARCRMTTFLSTALAGAARIDPCGG